MDLHQRRRELSSSPRKVGIRLRKKKEDLEKSRAVPGSEKDCRIRVEKGKECSEIASSEGKRRNNREGKGGRDREGGKE